MAGQRAGAGAEIFANCRIDWPLGAPSATTPPVGRSPAWRN